MLWMCPRELDAPLKLHICPLRLISRTNICLSEHRSSFLRHITAPVGPRWNCCIVKKLQLSSEKKMQASTKRMLTWHGCTLLELQTIPIESIVKLDSLAYFHSSTQYWNKLFSKNENVLSKITMKWYTAKLQDRDLRSQRLPTYPLPHVHRKLLASWIHCPPLWHGLGSHELFSEEKKELSVSSN